MKYLKKRITFHLALIAEEPTMLRRIVGTKINLLFIILSAIILTTMRNIAKQKKKKLNNKHNKKQICLKKTKMMMGICLWHHKQSVLMN
jgi:hypothetical protein